MPSAPARWRQRLRAWLLARQPVANTLTLTQRNIYILPTGSGWLLAATLAVLLVASINYQLNLGYVLTFMLAGAASAGMVMGHGTLRGLALKCETPAPVFAGTPALLTIGLINRRRHPRLAIGLAMAGARSQWSWTDVPAAAQAELRLRFRPVRRGLHPVPPLRVETRFPLGTFRVWTRWQPAARVLVYPKPEAGAPPLPAPETLPGSAQVRQALMSPEFDGVREYRRGDPLKLVLWKKWASTGTPVVRDSSRSRPARLWLDHRHTAGLPTEAALSRLTAWVLAADARELEYGLRLPGAEIAPGRGDRHRQRCLEALATC